MNFNFKANIVYLILFGLISLTILLVGNRMVYDKEVSVFNNIVAAKSIEQKVTEAHLWFEELVAHDEFIDFDNQILKNLQKSEEKIKFIQENALEDPLDIKMVDSIQSNFLKFSSILLQRKTLFDNTQKLGIGNSLDQDFDLIFNNLLKDLNEFSDKSETERYELDNLRQKWQLGFVLFLVTGVVFFVVQLIRSFKGYVSELNEERERSFESIMNFQNMIKDASMAILIVNSNGIISEVNKAGLETFGYQEDEILGASVDILIPQKFRSKHGKHIIKYFSNPQKRKMGETEVKLEGAKADGTVFPLEISLSYFFKGDEIFGVAFVQDLTVRVEKEKFKVEKELAIKTSNIKEEFLANMSHEIRTPLNGIIGLVDILKESKDLSEENAEHISIIQKSSNDLLNILNDILDLSKMDSGTLNIVNSEFNIFELVNRIAGLFMAKSKEKGLEMNVYLENDFPFRLVGDSSRLSQVLSNLVGNAVKFTDKGSIDITLKKIEDNSEKIKLRFEIKDSGEGMSEDEQKLLFNRFQQLDQSSTKKVGGTGLGLSISRKLIEMMGGNIGVESKKGEGSLFYFELDFEVADQKVDKDSGTESLSKEVNYNGKKVLLVDDIKVNITVAKIMLEKLGFEVDLAYNGQEAIDKFEENKYDMVLMDIQMPVMDGAMATQTIKLKYKNVPPIIGLSANAMEGDAEKYIKLGLDDYLTKPITMEKLKNKLSQIDLNHHSI